MIIAGAAVAAAAASGAATGTAAAATAAATAAAEDRSNGWIIGVVGFLGLLLAIVPPLDDRVDLATLDGNAVRWTGVGLYAIGGALRLWPVYTCLAAVSVAW